jgi:ribosomal protein S27AE
MAFKAAQCPSCGANIQVPDDRDRANCMYCGSSISVKEAIAAAGLPNSADILKVAMDFIDSGNSQEANQQITRVLEYEPDNPVAWLCKAAVTADISQAQSYVKAALTKNLDDERLKKKFAGVFLKSAQTHIGLNPDGSYLFDSAYGEIQAAIQAQSWINAGVRAMHCDAAYSHLTIALKHLEMSFDLCPSPETGQHLLTIKSLPDTMPVEGKTSGQEIGQSRLVYNWQTNQIPALLKLMERVAESYPDFREKVRVVEQQKQQQACFVVTATMGVPNHPTVVLLREFRDAYLLQRSAGRLVVKWYYKIGPHVARAITQRRTLRRVSYWLIVQPVAKVAEYSMTRIRREQAQV